MAGVDVPGGRTHKVVELKGGTGAQDALHKRLLRLERLVCAIEEELADEQTSDEQKLQNIGERVASVTDGR